MTVVGELPVVTYVAWNGVALPCFSRLAKFWTICLSAWMFCATWLTLLMIEQPPAPSMRPATVSPAAARRLATLTALRVLADIEVPPCRSCELREYGLWP